MKSLLKRFAVCSWSLQPADADVLITQVKSIGIPRIQLALDPLRTDIESWNHFGERCRDNEIEIVSGMFGTEGEDYTSLESIRRTGGIVPDATWKTNLENIRTNADIAAGLNLKLVTFHVGFMPHDRREAGFEVLLNRVIEIADIFAERGIELAFETGQEEAETLRLFLKELNRADVGVNFDPANMLLYGKGDPVSALRILSPWLKQCHIKDARKTRQPGTWGEEVPVGAGEVDWSAFFNTLNELNFNGYCDIGSAEPVHLDMTNVATYREFDKLLADTGIEVVDICSPTSTHASFTVAALQAGKHVLCEKPIARTAEQAHVMAKAAAESSSFYMPGMCLRFWPEWAWLQRAIAENRYGRTDGAPLRFFEDGQSPREVRCGDNDGYSLELQYFLDCIRSGKAPSTVTPEDGVISLEICEAEEKSVQSGKEVFVKYEG